MATYLYLLLSSQAFLQRIRQNVADSVEKGLTEENVKVRARASLLLLALLLPGDSELQEFRGLAPGHCLPPTRSLLSAALEGLPWEGDCTPAPILSTDAAWPFCLLTSSCPLWCL